MIKNIIFDIGNVIVQWQPATVVKRLFPEHDTVKLTEALFKSTPWYDLNLGKITESEITQIYHQTLGINIETLNRLMQEIKESLLPVDNNFILLTNLYSQYTLYALTDNVREIMSYLKKKYDFWSKFKGIIVSAEVGYLKPDPAIYQELINQYEIDPAESVFIDDHLPNVQGAKSMNMHAIQFANVEQCIHELKKIGVKITNRMGI